MASYESTYPCKFHMTAIFVARDTFMSYVKELLAWLKMNKKTNRKLLWFLFTLHFNFSLVKIYKKFVYIINWSALKIMLTCSWVGWLWSFKIRNSIKNSGKIKAKFEKFHGKIRNLEQIFDSMGVLRGLGTHTP